MNLKECILKIHNALSVDDRKKLKNSASLIDYHFGLGMWIRNNCGLWSDSSLITQECVEFSKHIPIQIGSEPDGLSQTLIEIYKLILVHSTEITDPETQFAIDFNLVDDVTKWLETIDNSTYTIIKLTEHLDYTPFVVTFTDKENAMHFKLKWKL